MRWLHWKLFTYKSKSLEWQFNIYCRQPNLLLCPRCLLRAFHTSALLGVAVQRWIRFLPLPDLATRARGGEKKGKELWKLPSSQGLLAEKLSSASTFTILHTWSNNSHFAYGFHFSFLLQVPYFSASVLILASEQKHFPEGRQAPAQKTRIPPSHTEARETQQARRPQPGTLPEQLQQQPRQEGERRPSSHPLTSAHLTPS